MALRRRVALALACACALATLARGAEVVFDPPSGTTRERTLRVRVEALSHDASSETPAIVYTLNGAKPSTRAGGDTKAYESEIVLPVGTWTVKAAMVSDGKLGEVAEAKYDVRERTSRDASGTLTAGGLLGIALLLVMGLFGFVVFAGVCTAGYNALFKTAPTIRGPGASDPRMPRTMSSGGMMELGEVNSIGFRNNPASTGAHGGGEDTVNLLRSSASSSDMTPTRSGKRD